MCSSRSFLGLYSQSEPNKKRNCEYDLPCAAARINVQRLRNMSSVKRISIRVYYSMYILLGISAVRFIESEESTCRGSERAQLASYLRLSQLLARKSIANDSRDDVTSTRLISDNSDKLTIFDLFDFRVLQL